VSSSAELDAAAARLEAEAGLLPGLLDAVLRASTPEAWEGPAASRFDDELALNRVRLRNAADDLRVVARSLRAQAVTARAEEKAAQCPRLVAVGGGRVC
jgi:uncharacterized protein YukE